MLTAARARGLELRLHAEQFRPGTGAALAAELNARTADHLETATPEVLDALRAADVRFKDLATTQTSLEDIFVSLLRNGA